MIPPRKHRLALGICAHRVVPPEFIIELTRFQGGDPVPVIMAESVFVQQARCQVVVDALGHDGWDRLLFLDVDMTFPTNLRELAEEWMDPIVGGLYFQRGGKYEPVAGNFASIDKPLYANFRSKQIVPKLESPGIYSCDVLGTGCLGVRRDVLEKWPERNMPWFSVMQAPDGTSIVGEDVWFCWQAKRQGIQPKLDTRVQCGHSAQLDITTASYVRVHRG